MATFVKIVNRKNFFTNFAKIFIIVLLDRFLSKSLAQTEVNK